MHEAVSLGRGTHLASDDSGLGMLTISWPLLYEHSADN